MSYNHIEIKFRKEINQALYYSRFQMGRGKPNAKLIEAEQREAERKRAEDQMDGCFRWMDVSDLPLLLVSAISEVKYCFPKWPPSK